MVKQFVECASEHIRVQRASGLRIELQRDVQVEV